MKRIALFCALLFLPASVQAGEVELEADAKALDWLLKEQHENGGFGQSPGEELGEIGITGLVVKGICGAPGPSRTRAGAKEASRWCFASSFSPS